MNISHTLQKATHQLAAILKDLLGRSMKIHGGQHLTIYIKHKRGV